MENGTRLPSCQSHYLRSNAIMRSTKKRFSLSFEPYKSGGTSLKAPNTSSRYGRTTKPRVLHGSETAQSKASLVVALPLAIRLPPSSQTREIHGQARRAVLKG